MPLNPVYIRRSEAYLSSVTSDFYLSFSPGKQYRTTLSRRCNYLESAALLFYQHFENIEANSCTTFSLRMTAWLEKPEEFGLLFAGHARTIITDIEFNKVSIITTTNVNQTLSLVVVLDGIAKQVLKDLL